MRVMKHPRFLGGTTSLTHIGTAASDENALETVRLYSRWGLESINVPCPSHKAKQYELSNIR
jgi:hypothetical protein